MNRINDVALFLTITLFVIIAVVLTPIDYSSDDLLGFASSTIYYGYAVPISSVIVNNNLSFASSSDSVLRSLDVSDDIIYRLGYVSYDSQSWTPFDIAPSNTINGEWISTRGTAGLTFTPSLLHLNNSRNFSNNTYIIVYTCSKNTTIHNWSCHDGWQITKFDAKLNSATGSGSKIVIYAAGRSGNGSYPTMQLSINNNILSSWIVTGDVLIPTFYTYNYTYQGIIDKNTIVRVNYPNDVIGSARDLRVDKIIIDGITYESEAPANINTGIWDGTNCGGIAYPGNEWLNCTGYIQYALSGTTSACSGSNNATCTITNGQGTKYRTCNNGNWSAYGACTINSCNVNYDNCDNSATNGCEASLLTSASNCGQCGRACNSTQTCTNGICIISNSNNNSCTGTGTQTQQCPITNGQGQQSRTCVNNNWTTWGTCLITVCNTNYDNCDNNQANGCETNLQTSASNCGQCIRTCSNMQTCTAGICTTTTQTLFCGDGTCNNGETCSNCSSDCGSCQSYSGTVYYVSNSGFDTNTGTSASTPWKTISYVNTKTFKAGDAILFNRGDIWHESLAVKSSGTASAPITYGAYGSGNNPIISGFTTLSSWSSVSGLSGVYQSSCTSCASNLYVLTMNGVPKAMGRYPNLDATNKGYLSFESSSTNSITDGQLTGTPNWAGAVAVLRANSWTMDTAKISSHSGSTLTFQSSVGSLTNGNGYFIENDEKTLDELGEWYFNPSIKSIEMYFGSSSPSSYEIKASTTNTLVSLNGNNYVTFDGLSFEGANTDAFSVASSQHFTLRNSKIFSSGGNAVYSTSSPYITIENCNINYSYDDGIYFRTSSPSPNSAIRGNIISNTFPFAGMGTDSNTLPSGTMTWGSDNVVIDSNQIYNSGYNGIYFTGQSNTIKNNLIDTFCTVMDDGGGIYTTSSSSGTPSQANSIIQDNIVLNGIGIREGKSNNMIEVEAIYLDGHSKGVEVSGNTAANTGNSGIYVQYYSSNSNIHDNTLYNNNKQIVLMGGTVNNNIQNNIFFAKMASQLCLNFYCINSATEIQNLGLIDYNYYARPLDDTGVFSIYLSGSTKYTLQQWQTTYNHDLNSHKSPKTTTNVNDILFEYNPTKTDKVVALSGNYIDVKGTAYSGSVTLKPFTSIVLIKN